VRVRTRALALLLGAALAGGCAGDDTGSSDPVALDGPGASDAGIGAGDDGAGDDGGEAAADGASEDDGAAEADVEPPHADVVDAGVAEPGTWQVGEAGTVTFSLDRGGLQLDGAAPADGWQVVEQEADREGIEVVFAHDRATAAFEVELEKDGGSLSVLVDLALEDGEPGTFALGDAASVTVSVDGDRLVLEDLTVTDGWEVVTRELDDDEFELELARGDQRAELAIDLDDGRVDVERHLSVRGPA
jgi:hypothetical protein